MSEKELHGGVHLLSFSAVVLNSSHGTCGKISESNWNNILPLRLRQAGTEQIPVDLDGRYRLSLLLLDN